MASASEDKKQAGFGGQTKPVFHKKAGAFRHLGSPPHSPMFQFRVGQIWTRLRKCSFGVCRKFGGTPLQIVFSCFLLLLLLGSKGQNLRVLLAIWAKMAWSNAHTVDARNPLRTTLKPWKAYVCWYVQASHHFRGSWVVQKFVHPQYQWLGQQSRCCGALRFGKVLPRLGTGEDDQEDAGQATRAWRVVQNMDGPANLTPLENGPCYWGHEFDCFWGFSLSENVVVSL